MYSEIHLWMRNQIYLIGIQHFETLRRGDYFYVDKIALAYQFQRLLDEMELGDYDYFFRRLRSFFVDSPYKLVYNLELHY